MIKITIIIPKEWYLYYDALENQVFETSWKIPEKFREYSTIYLGRS